MPNPYTRDGHVHQTAITVTAGAASIAIVDFPFRIKLLRWGNTVTTAIVVTSQTTDGVFTIMKLDHDRSTQTALDTYTVDTARAVGHAHYADLHAVAAANNPIDIGEAVELDHTTASAGGSAAGAIKVWFTYEILGPLWDSTYHHSF